MNLEALRESILISVILEPLQRLRPCSYGYGFVLFRIEMKSFYWLEMAENWPIERIHFVLAERYGAVNVSWSQLLLTVFVPLWRTFISRSPKKEPLWVANTRHPFCLSTSPGRKAPWVLNSITHSITTLRSNFVFSTIPGFPGLSM